MKENFREQFRNLNTIILSNVDTLKGLISQSKSLSEIINQLGDKEENTEIKKALEETQTNISSSIEKLTQQTQKLFEVYNKLIDQVFG